MPHFNLRHFMERLAGWRGGEVFVLQVGAMDGVTFDPMHEFITGYQWQGLLVEPIAEHFSTLQAAYQNYPQVRLANVAVAERSGKALINRIPTQHVENASVPRWGLGATSFYTDRNALHFDEVRPFVVQEEVDCLTLPDLLTAHDVQAIDVLQIDTEGFDYNVLKQMDFTHFHPHIINMEIVNLPKAEQNAARRLLDEQGYLHAKGGYDLLAVSKELLAYYAASEQPVGDGNGSKHARQISE